jgi:hypothetical protein
VERNWQQLLAEMIVDWIIKLQERAASDDPEKAEPAIKELEDMHNKGTINWPYAAELRQKLLRPRVCLPCWTTKFYREKFKGSF